MNDCVLLQQTPWMWRVLYDDFSSQSWKETFVVLNEEKVSVADKSLRFNGASGMFTNLNTITSLSFSFTTGNVDDINASVYFFSNLTRGADVSLRNGTVSTYIRPGKSHSSVDIGKNYNKYTFTVENGVATFYVDDIYSHGTSFPYETSEMSIVMWNNRNDIPLDIQSIDLYYNMTGYSCKQPDGTTPAEEIQQDDWRKHTASIAFSSAFVGLLAIGGGAYALKNKNRKNRGEAQLTFPENPQPVQETRPVPGEQQNISDRNNTMSR